MSLYWQRVALESSLINMRFFFLVIIFVTPAKLEEMTSDDRRNLGLQFYFLTAV